MEFRNFEFFFFTQVHLTASVSKLKLIFFLSIKQVDPYFNAEVFFFWLAICQIVT